MNLTKINIPPKERKEWELLVTLKSGYKFRNFVIQISNAQLCQKIATSRISKRQAIDELYDLCSKYACAVQNDFEVIFKKW